MALVDRLNTIHLLHELHLVQACLRVSDFLVTFGAPFNLLKAILWPKPGVGLGAIEARNADSLLVGVKRL